MRDPYGDNNGRNEYDPLYGGKNSNYSQGGYSDNYGGQYYGQVEEKKSNTALIAVISALAAVIVIGAVVIILMLTGVINVGGKDPNTQGTSAASVPVQTQAPTQAPAPVQAQQPAQQPPQAPAENNVVSKNVYVANVKNSIYLRSAPVEVDSNIICEIPLGTQVGFIENVDSVFAKINYNGQIGYSKQQYLSDVKPAAQSSNNTVQSYMYVANVKYSIYFRSAPAENDSNIICEIPLGTQVGFIENTDGVFAKIRYDGQVGYVKREYLSSSKPYVSSGGSSSTMTVVNVDYAIYLRSSPSESSDSNIIMEIPVGATVKYLDTPNSTFYKISYNGTVGYSKQIYLSFN